MRWATGLSSAVFVLGLGSILRAPPPPERNPQSFLQYPTETILASPMSALGLVQARNLGHITMFASRTSPKKPPVREHVVVANTREPEATARPPPLTTSGEKIVR